MDCGSYHRTKVEETSPSSEERPVIDRRRNMLLTKGTRIDVSGREACQSIRQVKVGGKAPLNRDRGAKLALKRRSKKRRRRVTSLPKKERYNLELIPMVGVVNNAM